MQFLSGFEHIGTDVLVFNRLRPINASPFRRLLGENEINRDILPTHKYDNHSNYEGHYLQESGGN
jgi:hypothetical protein